jgi:PEGA domain
VRYRSGGMTRVALVTVLALAGAARAQDAPDGGMEVAPQAEDREAPPMAGKGGKTEPKPAEPPPPAPEPKQKPKARHEAQPAPEAARPEPASPQTQTPPRVTAHCYDEDAQAVIATPVEAAVAEELAADGRLRFTAKSDILMPADRAPKALGEADVEAMDAEDALTQGDVDKAKQLLEKALKTYQGFLPQLAARGGGLEPFRDGWLKLARARFFDGDQKGAREAMRFVFVLDPSIKWDPKKFPAAMKKVVVESRLLFDTLGPGTLNIDSDPPGATVYLNGKKLDKLTPLEGVPAQPGPNYISYERRDWSPVGAIFEVAGGGETASAVRSLEHFPGRPLQPLYRAQKELDKGGAPDILKESAEKLGVDMLVLVRIERGEAGTLLVGYLYDARPNKILKRAEKLAGDGEAPVAARELAKELVTGVRLDGIIPVVEKPKKPSMGARIAASFREFRASKAFWPVVGGLVGVIVVGTAVGVGVGVGMQPHGLTPAQQVVLIGGH